MRIPFELPPGIFSDDTTFAQEGAYSDGSNVRFRLGRPETIGGVLNALNGGSLTGVCRNALAFLNANGALNQVFGTHEKLELSYQDALYDITPADLVPGNASSSGDGGGWGRGEWGRGTWGSPAATKYARTWALDSYGNHVVANPRGGTIYMWEADPNEPAVPIDNAPAVVSYALVTPERQILAFGCNEEVSGNFNPLCIRGSDIEDYTDWTTSSSNNAFEHILEGGGRIVAARVVGSFVAVWTTEAVYLGQFIGAPGQAYRFDLVSDSCGLSAPNAIAILDQTAIWLGRDYQFRFWAVGAGVPQVLTCPIWRDFKDNVVSAQKEKIAGGTISQLGEAWFHYPDARDGTENSRYLAFSVSETSDQRAVWFKGQMPRTMHLDAGAIEFPIMADAAGNVWQHEAPQGNTPDNFIRSAAQYIEEGGRRVMVRSFEPDFEEQQTDIALTLTVRDYPNGPEIEKGPYNLAPGARKKDFRASGRMMTATLASSGRWRLGKPVLDAVPTGGR